MCDKKELFLFVVPEMLKEGAHERITAFTLRASGAHEARWFPFRGVMENGDLIKVNLRMVGIKFLASVALVARCLALQHGPDETQSKAECHHHSQPDSSPRQRCRGPLCSKD